MWRTTTTTTTGKYHRKQKYWVGYCITEDYLVTSTKMRNKRTRHFPVIYKVTVKFINRTIIKCKIQYCVHNTPKKMKMLL